MAHTDSSKAAVLGKGYNFGHSYTCLDCAERTNWDNVPDELICPSCESEDMVWVPQKFKTPSDIDQTLRRIADRHGLGDLGQRGGTRAGEAAKRARPEPPKAEKYVNIGGVNVPVTNGVTSTWATTTMDTKIAPKAGVPYGGIAQPKSIPTKVVHSYSGEK